MFPSSQSEALEADLKAVKAKNSKAINKGDDFSSLVAGEFIKCNKLMPITRA
jgi:hypothetical protein